MGHERVGRLPRTRRWVAVVETMKGASEDEAAVFDVAHSTLSNVRNRLNRIEKDPGVRAAFRYLIALSRPGDPTTGEGRFLHPIQEADKAVAHLQSIRGQFDELLILKFEATNTEPFSFRWVDAQATQRDYSSILVRISSEFERRF